MLNLQIWYCVIDSSGNSLQLIIVLVSKNVSKYIKHLKWFRATGKSGL